MRDSGSVSPGRLGDPPRVGESWRWLALRQLLLDLMLLACAPLRAQQPAITAVVNAASYEAGAVVPGGIATLFGTGIVSASGILETAGVPLPTTGLLSGSSHMCLSGARGAEMGDTPVDYFKRWFP